MLGVTLAVMLQATLVGDTNLDYESAYREADSTGKPMLILVGTEWCPGCVVMKNSLIPRMQREGRLRGVVYAAIDADQRPDIARRIMSGNGYPQLVIYRKSPTGWKRQIVKGAQSETTVERMIERAVAAQEAELGIELRK